MTSAAVARAGDDSTRARMLAAAVECILEEGYYRASSNRIAERAGVTWGVIQHHFGTREKLLLEVVRSGAEDLLEVLRAATIAGDTLEARLDSLAEVIWGHYRRPEFLAHVQAMLNLAKDPKTGADTVQALASIQREVGVLLRGLVDDVGLPDADELGVVVFDLMRGAAIGESLMQALPRGTRATVHDTRPTLVAALAALATRG